MDQQKTISLPSVFDQSIAVRQARGEDVHYILDIDVKCFDDPWPAEHWRLVCGELNIAVATVYGTPIGMVVFTLMETEDGVRFVSMTKLAVKEAFRNRGIGSTLLETVLGFGHEAEAGGVWITVPETSPAVSWLTKMGFKAVSVNRNCFDSYGHTQDGYMFQRPL